MQCPYCQGESKVTDSRDHADGVRRRRQCLSCKRKFTTYERKEAARLHVIKRDNRSQPFASEKIVVALRRVCRGLSLDDESLVRLAALVEAHFADSGMDARGKTIRSGEIAEQVLTRLYDIDRVAYQRMAVDYLDTDGRMRTDKRGAPRHEKQLGLFGDDAD